MRISELLNERYKRSDVFYETTHKFLYHLTDHHGFGYTISQNALKGLRQSYISTTYDPNKNGVYGYWHYDFKFVLDGQALVAEYGGFHHDHFIAVGPTRKMESLKEKEIGIDTPVIEPFNKYLVGVVLLMPLFSQKAIQWLLYDNYEYGGSFLSAKKSQAPRAIEALFTVMNEWNKPVWMLSEGGHGHRKLTDYEMKFLNDVFTLHKRGGDFEKGMRELSAKYPIKDHWNVELDKKTVIRRQSAERLYKMYNKYYQDRPYTKVDPNVPREMMKKVMSILDLNSNIQTVVMGHIEEAGLFHPTIAPVDWGIIIKHLMDGDVEDTLEAIQWVKKDRARIMQMYDNDPEDSKYARHAGTRF